MVENALYGEQCRLRESSVSQGEATDWTLRLCGIYPQWGQSSHVGPGRVKTGRLRFWIIEVWQAEASTNGGPHCDGVIRLVKITSGANPMYPYVFLLDLAELGMDPINRFRKDFENL